MDQGFVAVAHVSGTRRTSKKNLHLPSTPGPRVHYRRHHQGFWDVLPLHLLQPGDRGFWGAASWMSRWKLGSKVGGL